MSDTKLDPKTGLPFSELSDEEVIAVKEELIDSKSTDLDFAQIDLTPVGDSVPEVEPDKTQFIYDEVGAPIYNGTNFVRDPEEAEAILAERAKNIDVAPKLSEAYQKYLADVEKLQVKYEEKVQSILNG